MKEIDAHLLELGRAPETNAEVIGVLQRYRTDMVDQSGAAKSLDLDVIRGMRTGLRGKTNVEKLRGTDAERRAGLVMDAADQDIRGQLTGGALSAYDRANRIWKGRSQKIDQVVSTFIGGKGDAALPTEKVANNLPKMANPKTGNASALRQMMGTLSADEKADVSATIAARLGRKSEEGDADFSSARFFSEVQKISPAARRAIWGDQGAQDLADLAMVAEARTGTRGRLNNSSSGRVGGFQGVLAGILGGGVGASMGVPGAGVGVAAGVIGTGAGLAGVLGSPKAVSVLAYAARATTIQRQGTALRRIAALAAKDPALSQDLLPIKEKLEEAWAKDHRRRD